MNWMQKYEKLQVLDRQACIRMPFFGRFEFVTSAGYGARHAMVSITGWGDTPAQAVLDAWKSVEVPYRSFLDSTGRRSIYNKKTQEFVF